MRFRHVVLPLLLALAACGDAGLPSTSAQRYRQWLPRHANEVADYRAYLASRGVAGVLPMQELLRSGRRWRTCAAAELTLPPRDAWPSIVATLELVRELQVRDLLPGPRVGSVYRNPALNRCEGGAPRSRHRSNSAIDFDLSERPDGVARLCRFWRDQGAASAMGLGFYAPTRIHVDTSGHRTWGRDHRRATSLCVAVDQRDAGAGANRSRAHTPK